MASKTCKLVFASALENSNKIYIVELQVDGTVYGSYGRIGAKLTRTKRGHGEAIYEATIREKQKKGYTELKVHAEGKAVISGKSLEQLALTQIRYSDPSIADLIKYFVSSNRHQIELSSGGSIKVEASGVIRTITGDILTPAAVHKAMGLLDNLYILWQGDAKSPTFYQYLDEYLMLIPQRVGRGDWDNLFADAQSFHNQRTFLDQLLSSAEMSRQKVDTEDAPKLFNTTIEVVDVKDIANSFESSKYSGHHDVTGYKVTKAYRIHIGPQYEKFQAYGATLTNHALYWHGTMSGNLLSILRTGYVVPPESASHVTGRMFGPGVYFSDQSTKSLNYSAGVWAGSTERPKRVFLLLNQVAMGTFERPTKPTSSAPPAGYHSYYVAGGTANVLNNEMIVPRADQVYITHLVELTC